MCTDLGEDGRGEGEMDRERKGQMDGGMDRQMREGWTEGGREGGYVAWNLMPTHNSQIVPTSSVDVQVPILVEGFFALVLNTVTTPS